MRRYTKGWLIAGMSTLAIPGANLVYGQESMQSSSPVAQATPQASEMTGNPAGPWAPSPQALYSGDQAGNATRSAGQIPSPRSWAPFPRGNQPLGSPAPAGSGQAVMPLSNDARLAPITTGSPTGVPTYGGGSSPAQFPGSGTGTAPAGAGGPATGGGAPPGSMDGTLSELGAPAGAGAQAGFTDPFMIGDQGPFSILQARRFPPVPGPIPPGRPVPGSSPFSKLNRSVNAIVPAVRGFKIADNQSPRPMDRIFVDFNYYDNVNSALNRRLNAPISNMQAYHELFGFEKTFFDGNASLGLRVPLNSLSVDSGFPSLGGFHTAAGNLAVFGKYVLYQDDGGNLLSAGLSIDTPTGPASFAGYPVRFAQNAVGIQPFLGYILKQDNWFLQGFGSIDVPTVSSMPTMMYLDAGIGYILYRTQEQRLLTAIVPTYELHMNIPLNHSGYSITDLYGVPPVLDMTFGVNFGLFNTSYLTAAYVVPVTGPQPFSGEFALQFNFLFGRSRRAGLGRVLPPIAGG
jgi:hypothetical protein